jgi:hypothetical protein
LWDQIKEVETDAMACMGIKRNEYGILGGNLKEMTTGGLIHK